MSQQQVQRLQTLLETVQRNRQRPGEPIGAAANVVQGKAPANTTKGAAEPARARVPTPEVVAGPAAAAPARPAKPAAPATQPKVGAPAQAPAAAQAPATQPKAGAPAQPPAVQTPGSQPKAGAPMPRTPEPQPAAQEPIVPRTFEPEVPRAMNRPIAQLVSKHAPVVDATFGAMLKRSLSLRPH